jgi:acetyl-CoA acetyltransferase family protein
MRNAVIVDAVRTPVGRRGGFLKDWHSVDLASETLKEVVERNDLDPGRVDDVIMGCVTQTGEQGINIARNAALAAGYPEEVPGTTVDRQCGSSQQSAHFAAQGVIAGAYDVVIAAGVESMTRVPMGSNAMGPGSPFGPRMSDRYDHQLVPQGLSAEMIAEKWSVDRDEIDQISLESHQRAARATDEGRFERQIMPIDTPEGRVSTDGGIRRETSLEKLATLKPAFKEDGVVTAGNSSQISDGSAALLIMGEDTAEELGYQPIVRFKAFAVTAADPVIMLSAPIPATSMVLDRAGMSIDEIDLFEVNEAFATVIAAWRKEHGNGDSEGLWNRTNVNGGAVALGHPLGASGARLMTTLVHEMQRTDSRYGLQTMCEGGGMANATILELV